MPEGTQQARNWSNLDSTDRDSTLSNFVEGWQSDDGTEVLIWEGEEDEKGASFETHLEDSPPEYARYLIEVVEDDEVKNEKFAVQEETAHKVAENLKEDYNDGN